MINLERFAKDFADFIANKNVYTFFKGRIGLFTIHRSLGIICGDCVTMYRFTSFVLLISTMMLGSKFIYFDINSSYKNSQNLWKK